MPYGRSWKNYSDSARQPSAEGEPGSNATKNVAPQYWRYAPPQMINPTTQAAKSPVRTNKEPVPVERFNPEEEPVVLDYPIPKPIQQTAPPAPTATEIAKKKLSDEIARLLGVAGGTGLKSEEQAKRDYINTINNLVSSQSSVVGLAPGQMQSNVMGNMERASIQQDLAYQKAAQEERQKALDDAVRLLMEEYGADLKEKEQLTALEQLDWLTKTQPEIMKNYKESIDLGVKPTPIDYGSLVVGTTASGAGAALPYISKKMGW